MNNFTKKHLECAALWPNCWNTIMDIINEKLQWETDNLYKKLNGKLDRLQMQLYTPTPKRQQTASFPRTITT